MSQMKALVQSCCEMKWGVETCPGPLVGRLAPLLLITALGILGLRPPHLHHLHHLLVAAAILLLLIIIVIRSLFLLLTRLLVSS